MTKTIWCLVLILSWAAVCSAQTVLYFPQFVDGSQNGSSGVTWQSAIVITNPAAPATPVASGSITLTQDNGSPMNLTFVDENGASLPSTFQLSGGQTALFQSPQSNSTSPLPFSSGFATVTSSLPVTGGLVFFESNSSGTFATAGVPPATALTKQGSVAVVFKETNSSTDVGIAFANPTASTATITFSLLDRSGNLIVPQATRTMATKNHTAFYVSQLFPNAPLPVIGTLRITSDNAVACIALLFQNATFGSLPIFSVN